jgi:phospholipase/lecithinase/hemolysin
MRHAWAAPGFSALALLALSGCFGGGGGGNGGSPGGTPSSPPSAPVVNPYAADGDSTPSQLGNLVVFGDSYSNPNQNVRPGVTVWPFRMGADTVDIYTKGGASARDENVGWLFNGTGNADNTFKNQVDRWAADAVPQKSNDLTVAFFGYNDIMEAGNDLSVSLADYGTQVDRLIDGGVTAGDRKLFVTLVHDWSQVPRELAAVAGGAESKQGRVDQFNQGVVDLANSRKDVIAVDLRTVFDRIAADPAKYGLTNLTTADAANSSTTALYFDDQHFGNRGQDIIAQVFTYYLTRGWSWANSLAAGSEATARLQQDIDDGLVASLDQQSPEARLGFSSFVVGDAGPHAAALTQDEVATDVARGHFAATRLMEDRDSGVGLNYALDQGTMLGVVISNYRGTAESSAPLATSQAAVESDAVSIYLRNRVAGFDLATTASFSDDRHQKLDHDELVGVTSESSFGGRTSSFATTASRSLRAGPGWLQPWVNLTHSVQQVDGFTQSNPYVSDVHFSGAEVNDTLMSVGLGGRLDPLPVGEEGWLTLTGGLSYAHGLAQGDYRVSMREEATGFVQDETIERDPTRTVGLRLGADLAMGERFSFDAAYALGQQLGGEASHDVTARLNYRF